MCKLSRLICFLFTFISNVNSLAIIKTNLTHLDKLYFKHNKRHKLFGNNKEGFSFINSCNSIYEPNFSKNDNFNLIGCNSSECKIYNRKTLLDFSLYMDGKDDKESDVFDKRSSNNDLKALPDDKSEFSGTPNKNSPRNKDSGSLDFNKWMFRGKEKMGDKLSEYEALMSEIQDLSKSKNKSDKDLYSFIQKNLKEASVDPDMKLTTRHIMRAIDEQAYNENMQDREWHRYMKKLKAKALNMVESMGKVPKIANPVDIVLESKAKEDSCGFRYPIDGSPEEIYTDPNSYKFWGRTPLSQLHSTHPTPETRGKVEEPDPNPSLEELITSSTATDAKLLEKNLKSMRESKFESEMRKLLELEDYRETNKEKEYERERENYGKKEIRNEQEQDVENKNNKNINGDEEGMLDTEERYRNVQLGNYYESFKRDFLESGYERQDMVLRVLNQYNPWDEYIKMRNLKSALPPIGINYKLNLKNLKVNFTASESVQENVVSEFLRDYLHYFLFLESDAVLFREFKESRFLYDVLKYFDLNEQIPVEEKKEYMDLYDKFFKMYFPEKCEEGFPKRPPTAEFPLTLDMNSGLMGLSDKLTGRTNSYHRVNMICCLMALAKCYTFVKQYTSDIFTEQRFKTILDTLETGLSLELQRMELGVSEIEVNNLDYRSLCEVDGTFLSMLTKVLGEWNIRRGVENILDLVLLLTLRKLNEVRGGDLISIITNVSYLTTLPRSVYVNFLSKIMEFVHQKLKFSLVNGVKYMSLEEALNFLSVILNYRELINKPFMETFVEVYRESIIDLGKELNRYKHYVVNLNKELSMDGSEGERSRLMDEEMEREDYMGNKEEQDLKDIQEERQKEMERERERRKERENILNLMEMKREQVFPLISCLQLAGLKEHMYLVHQLSKAFSTDDLNLNSTAAISVLENFKETDEFQREVIARAKNNLIKSKYSVDKERILETLEVYVGGVKEGRLEPDPYFFCTMIKQFCFLREPDADQLVEAAFLTDEFSDYLNQNQLFVIFRDLTRTPLYFNFLTRIGLRGEFLNYPISTVAQVLYYSSKNNVIIEKNWKTFYDMVKLFKHILTIDDVVLILDALLVSNFTGVDKLLDILCKRVCNLIEISDVKSEKVFEIMEKCLKLDYVPIQLLRFYTYSNLFEIQNSDHVRSLVDGPLEYDIDFRGWKRPVTYDEHTERIRLDHNVFPEIKMRGSRPLVDDVLKYSVQPALKEPRSFQDVERKHVNNDILKSLNKFIDKVKESNYKFTESDKKLIKSLVKIVGD